MTGFPPTCFARRTLLCALLVGLTGSLVTVAGQTSAFKVAKSPLILKEGGTADHPAIYDGQGMVIDLGEDVTGHDWIREGDLWTSRGSLAGKKAISAGQNTALFVDEVPIVLARRGQGYVPPSELPPGKMGVKEDGSFYFRWPEGKSPGQAQIYALPRAGASCVTIACSHIIVKNITAIHANNDGFNIHGDFVGIRLENIRALSNADEGISAHDNVEMVVENAEIAWNGSSDGGVADVNNSKTSYNNCFVHDNAGIGGMKFFGREHRVTNTRILNQKQDFYLGPKTVFSQENITH